MNPKLKENWNEITPAGKVLFLLRMLLGITVVVLAVLQLTNVFPNADDIYMPAMGVLMFLQAAQVWKTQRPIAIFSLLVGLFIAFIALEHFHLLHFTER